MILTAIEEYKHSMLRAALYEYPDNTPTMVTYTTTLSNRLKAKFVLRQYFIRYVNLMRSRLPFRQTYRLPVCWAIEESENSVHVHALYGTWVPLRSHEKGWNMIDPLDTGKAYVTTGADWEKYIDYIHKSYDHISRFIGHYSIFK